MQKNSKMNMSTTSNTIDIKRYLHLVRDNIVKIILLSVIFYLVWIFVFPMVYKYSPVYTTKSIVRFDDPRNRSISSGVAEFASLGVEGKLAILETTSLLGKVVDSLNLNLVIANPNYNIFKMMSDVAIGSDAKIGKYEFKFDKKVEVYYSNDKENIEDVLAFESKFISGGKINFNIDEFSFTLDHSKIERENKIVFYLIPKRIAIENVRTQLYAQLDRSKTILEIYFTGTNAEYAEIVNNAITEKFVDQLLDYKRYQTSNIVDALSGQLKNARIALENSEEELKTFRENNPLVVISGENNQTVNNLILNEKSFEGLKQDKTDIDYLLAKNSKNFSEKKIELLEIITFLVSKSFLGSQILADQYKILLDEYNLLTSNYSKDHPIVKEHEGKLLDMEGRIRTKARQYVEKLDSQMTSEKSAIRGTRALLVNLPTKELRLAELIRNREINEEIVSKILVRYNEAKISDVSIVPDAYIVDSAEAPIVSLTNSLNLFRFGLGIIVGLILSILLFIGMDVLDPSIRSSKDIEAALDVPVLATVPLIGNPDEKIDEAELGKKINSKLITADYAPTVEGEAFRLLRTKLMLEGKLAEKKALIITSLNPNEGKSLVSSNLAITIAQQKYPTVLIDCDLRRGVLHNSFASKKTPGLSDLLKNNSEINWGTISNIIQETHIPNLFLISSGTAIPNPSELLGSPRMNQAIRVLKHKFGVVICDTAPMNYTPDAFVLNSFINNVVLVARYGETNAGKLSEKTKEFSNLQNDLVGVVINASKSVPKHDQYSYSYYQY